MEAQVFKFKLSIESSSGFTRLINYSEEAETVEAAMRQILAQRYLIIENTLFNLDVNGYKLLEIIHVK